MFNKIMTPIMLGLTASIITFGVNSMAQIPTNFKPKTIFTVNGKEVTPSEAMQAALKSEAVMKCQAVTLIPSKSGTSFSLRAPKKAKVSE